jgi:hypothetical protein
MTVSVSKPHRHTIIPPHPQAPFNEVDPAIADGCRTDASTIIRLPPAKSR